MSKDIKKIVVNMPNSLIEMVQSMPIFSYLKQNFPLAEVSVLVLEKHYPLLRNVNVDKTIVLKSKPFATMLIESGEDVISFLQKESFDVSINMSASFRSAYFLYQSKIPCRIGFARSLISLMLTDPVPGERFKDLLKPIGVEAGAWEPILYARKRNYQKLRIGIAIHKDHKIAKQKWYQNFDEYLHGEIPSVELFVQDCSGSRREDLFLSEEEIDAIYNLDVLVTDNHEVVEMAKALKTPVADVSAFVKQEELLPEDFFYQIKEAMLKPLQQKISTDTFFDFVPITSGKNMSISKSEKKVGVIILAGGMGRRLGYHKPKGLLPIGDSCLFDILLKKAKGAEKIAILTSPVTFEETKAYIGMQPIDLLEKKVYPTLEGDGVSPEGNGALFDALVYSRYWKEWKELDMISVLAVDNPLANPLDPRLLSTEKELAVIGVPREKREARLGVLCKKRDQLVVREYFTLGKDGLDGLGYSGNFAAAPSFFEKVAANELPFYKVEKKGKVFYERLVIDAFAYAKDFDVIEKGREDCFFPIKEKGDLTAYCKKMDLEGEKNESGIFR